MMQRQCRLRTPGVSLTIIRTISYFIRIVVTFFFPNTCEISLIGMTIKSLLNWGGLGDAVENEPPPVERWHTGRWEQKYHGHSYGHHKGGSKGGGSNAVLSALALLSFLFLINVMQQSLCDNNSTAPTAPTTALLIREEDGPVLLDNRENHQTKSRRMGSDDTSDNFEPLREISTRIMSKNGNS